MVEVHPLANLFPTPSNGIERRTSAAVTSKPRAHVTDVPPGVVLLHANGEPEPDQPLT